jgi:hypothetical protein
MSTFKETHWNDFKNSINELKEYKKLISEVDVNYSQGIYGIELRCRIDKRQGGNKEQTLDQIRGIKNITVVSVIEGTSESDVTSYTTTLKCKYELTQGKDPLAYKENVFIPGLVGIKGLSIKYVGRPYQARA